MDIAQGTPYCSPVNIYAGDYPDAVNSDIVIITSGIARKPGQSRLELAQTNVNIMKSITENIVKYAQNVEEYKAFLQDFDSLSIRHLQYQRY